MKKWWQWLIFSGIWITVTVINFIDQQSDLVIGYNLFAVLFFAVLGVCQYVCDKKGERGRRIFKYISIAAIVVIAAISVAILVYVLR